MDGHGRRSPAVNWLVSAFTENLGLKVTSLLIAMALFGMVRGAGNVQRAIEVSLLARLPPPSAHRVLLTDLPDKVRVTVRGSPSLVGSLRADELGPVQIDLSDGRRPSVNIDASLFQVPAGVQITQIQPSSLQLTWDALAERDVPVRAEISGTPAPGTQLVGGVEVVPPAVRVSGPALYVEALPAVRTDAVDISNLGPGRYERRVALDSPRHHVRYEFVGGVRVTFTIDREIVERRFERVPITPVGAARVSLRPPLATVVLRGAPQVLNAMDPAEIVPTVEVGDSAAALRGSLRAHVTLSHIPDGVSLVSIDPAEVIVVPGR
jgi:hypothetical protein